jgi:hypothetical protein
MNLTSSDADDGRKSFFKNKYSTYLPGNSIDQASRYLLIGFSFFNWLLMLWVFNAAKELRPAADDYCIGVRASLGPIGGFVNDWLTWSGFITPSFLTNLLVGVPLANGPIWIVSSLTFIAAGISTSLLMLPVISLSINRKLPWKRYIQLFLVLAPVFVTFWWVFLWFPSVDLNLDIRSKLALGLTHWQNLNSAYVIPVSMILAAAIFLLNPKLRRRPALTIAALGLGLATGLMGPTFGLASAFFLLTTLLWVRLSPMRVSNRYILDVGASLIAVLAGLLIAYQAPGTQLRLREIDSPDPEFTLTSIPGWLMAIFPENLFMLGELLFTWGGLAVFLVSIAISFHLRCRNRNMDSTPILMTSLGLLVFGISLTTATIFTDALSYAAYWHSSSIAVVAFAICLTFGTWMGSEASKHVNTTTFAIFSTMLGVGLMMGIGSALDLSTEINTREKAWIEGTAPIEGVIQDREADWVNGCWQQLVQLNPKLGDLSSNEFKKS